MGRGFTVIEIMVALVVITIGIVALYSMQVVAIDGNVASQEMTQATQLAERWAERLRREAILWTGRPQGLLEPGLDDDDWRDAVKALTSQEEMVNKDFISPSIDATALDPRYCVKYRVATVPPAATDARVLRIDVRVAWPRRETEFGQFINCPLDMLDPANLRHTWQVSVNTLLYRHGGGA